MLLLQISITNHCISPSRSWEPHQSAHGNFILIARLNSEILPNESSLQHCIAFWLELVSYFPFRKVIAIGYFVTNFKYELNILHRAGEVPVAADFVGDLVVVC